MKKLFSLSSRLLAAMLIFSMVAFTTACGDDDDVDCDKIEDQFDDLEDVYDEAWSEGDCEALEDVYNDAIALFKKAKSCDFVKDMIDESGADDFDDFIDGWEDERDADVEDCETPDV